MKQLLSLVLSFAMVSSSVLPCLAQAPGDTPSPSAASPAACIEQGRDAGRRTPTGGAFTVGFVSGLGLGLLGTGLAWAFQATPEPPAPELQSLQSAECRLAYADSYGKQGRSKKRGAVLTGGLIGTAVIVAVVAAAGAGSESD